MKKIILFILVLSLIGCQNVDKKDIDQLTRVDVHKQNNVKMITNSKEINQLKQLFKDIQWQEGELKMSSKPDVKVTLFIEYNENMPERLIEYSIWYEDQTVTIWDKEESRYGTLENNKLKELLNSSK